MEYIILCFNEGWAWKQEFNARDRTTKAGSWGKIYVHFFTWKIRPEARLNLIRKGRKVINYNIMEKLINGQTWYMKTKKYIFNLLHILAY